MKNHHSIPNFQQSLNIGLHENVIYFFIRIQNQKTLFIHLQIFYFDLRFEYC